jgi:hypothetical protein
MLPAISPVTRGRPVPLGRGDSDSVGDALVAGAEVDGLGPAL